MDKLFNRISDEIVNGSRKAKKPYFDNKDYIAVNISTNNFHIIGGATKRKIAFIDGGNIEIIGNNNFSFQLMRIYYTIYDNNKRIKSKRADYYVFIHAVEKASDPGLMVYFGEIYEKDKLTDTVEFDFTKNNERVKPESIINSIRRIYEIRCVNSAADELDSSDIIVMDGNLAVKNSKEYAEMEIVYEKITTRDIMLAGISKTSSIITDTGVNLVGYINNLAPEKLQNKKWHYHPICENNNRMHKAELMIAKLHEKSKYAFIVEVHNGYKSDINAHINGIIFNIANNSKDPVFLGYPYGLIEADKLARCQENEKDYLQIKFMQMNIGDKEKLSKILNTNKAHDILDSIN